MVRFIHVPHCEHPELKVSLESLFFGAIAKAFTRDTYLEYQGLQARLRQRTKSPYEASDIHWQRRYKAHEGGPIELR